jgi:hypothetical protein
MPDMDMQVTLKLRDQLSAQSTQALEKVATGARATGVAVAATGKASQAAGQAAVEAGRASQQAARQATTAISQQAAATDRATRSTQSLAQATSEAKARAEQMANAWRDLGHQERNVLGLVGRLRQVDQFARRAEQGLASAARAAGRLGQGVAQGGAALAAGGYVAGRALAKPVDFEHRLAQMANTAFAEEGVAGRRAGMGRLRGAVDLAVRQGGGTRDGAAEALDKMLASGAIKTEDAMRLLPTLQKFATASGASTGDLSDIAIRGIQQGFFKPEQVEQALDKAVVAGQMGGFELKDMARWLPQMMANAAGMKSMGGFERILASAQASAVTAGSKDQAGNNLVNLLQKLNSQDTAQDFKKLGIDLSGTLASAREKGMLPLDAFVQLIDKQVVGKDKRFQALKAKAATAQGSEKADTMDAMADILQASAIGKVVQDRQAMLALVAEMTQRGYIQDVLGGMGKAGGAGKTSFDVVAGTSAFKLQQAANEKDMAASSVLDHVSGPLGNVATKAADLAREFPALATAAVGATMAISAMGAAAGAWAGGRMLFGSGAAAAGVGAAGTAAAAGASTSALGRAWAGLKGGWTGAAGSVARRWGGVLGLGFSALDVIGTESNSSLSRGEKNAAHVATAGGAAGAWAGAALGAKSGAAIGGGIGAWIGGVGAVPGAAIGGAAGGLIGGAAGWWAGSSLGKKAGNLLFGGGETVVRNEIKLVADGRELAAVVNEVNSRQAQRH